jgi:hypothetical protein
VLAVSGNKYIRYSYRLRLAVINRFKYDILSLISDIVSSDCLRVRAFLNRFESCFHEFVYDGLVESAYLADEDFMCIGFYLSCMLVWNLVLNELVALPKPMIVEVLQESDG